MIKVEKFYLSDWKYMSRWEKFIYIFMNDFLMLEVDTSSLSGKNPLKWCLCDIVLLVYFSLIGALGIVLSIPAVASGIVAAYRLDYSKHKGYFLEDVWLWKEVCRG